MLKPGSFRQNRTGHKLLWCLVGLAALANACLIIGLAVRVPTLSCTHRSPCGNQQAFRAPLEASRGDPIEFAAAQSK